MGRYRNFDFETFTDEILRNPDNNFATPSEVIDRYEVKSDLDVPNYISWADTERDLSAWLSNDLQRSNKSCLRFR